MQKTQDSAETLALQVLGWLVGNEDLMPVFQGSTGVSEAEICDRAAIRIFGRGAGFSDDGRRVGLAFCDANQCLTSVSCRRVRPCRAGNR